MRIIQSACKQCTTEMNVRLNVPSMVKEGAPCTSWLQARRVSGASAPRSAHSARYNLVRNSIVLGDKGTYQPTRSGAQSSYLLHTFSEPMHRDIAGLPTGYHLNNVSQNHNLGPVVLKIHSKHLLTSGFVRMNLQLPKLAKAIRLDEIRLNVEQQTETQCLDEQDKRGTRFTEIIPLWTSRTSDLKGKTKSPGDCFSIDQHVRMLGEDRIRPSTPEASHTGIRVNHRISCTIVYLPLENNPRMEKKEYRVASGALVSSCHSLLDALQLPAYSEQGVKMDHIEHVKTASSPCLVSRAHIEAESTKSGQRLRDCSAAAAPQICSSRLMWMRTSCGVVYSALYQTQKPFRRTARPSATPSTRRIQACPARWARTAGGWLPSGKGAQLSSLAPSTESVDLSGD